MSLHLLSFLFLLCQILYIASAQPHSKTTLSNDPSITYHGAWEYEPDSGVMVSSQKGATASFNFNGTKLFLRGIGSNASKTPFFRVTFSIDSGDPATYIKPLLPGSHQSFNLQHNTSTLSSGSHSLLITNLDGTFGLRNITISQDSAQSPSNHPQCNGKNGAMNNPTSNGNKFGMNCSGQNKSMREQPNGNGSHNNGSASSSSSHGLSTGASIGITFGVLITVLLAVIIFILIRKRRRASKNVDPAASIAIRTHERNRVLNWVLRGNQGDPGELRAHEAGLPPPPATYQGDSTTVDEKGQAYYSGGPADPPAYFEGDDGGTTAPARYLDEKPADDSSGTIVAEPVDKRGTLNRYLGGISRKDALALMV